MNILEELEALKQRPLLTNESKLKPCTRCGNHNYEVKFAMNKDGRECYPYFCVICNTRSPIVESKAVAATLGVLRALDVKI
jgi:hypothetical protein